MFAMHTRSAAVERQIHRYTRSGNELGDQERRAVVRRNGGLTEAAAVEARADRMEQGTA
jgi:hypothetical protein